VTSSDARTDWEERVGRRRAGDGAPASSLPPPPALRARAGSGQVTLTWSPVEGAIGYLVQRAAAGEGAFEPVDHGGRDVLAVPGPVYCDTTGEPGTPYRYAVSSVRAVEADPGERSLEVEDASSSGPAEPISLTVDAGRAAGRLERPWRMLGSEHVSQLDYDERTGGRRIGSDFEESLRVARAELGTERIRAHSILHDELGTYREESGEPRYDFSRIVSLYERLLAIGIRPVVELSFMPADLAVDPRATVFEYRGIVSPPRDWERWGELVRRLTEALVERFGVDEVARWGFEVWNEPNLEVFWAGTQDEYFRLYDVAARAVKSVDERLLVGGPSTAAAGWIVDFLEFVRSERSPLDFLSTHTYGNYPVDVREAARVRGMADVEVWWTEWGVSPKHFFSITDSAFAAPFVLHGMKSVQGRAEALAYWVVSDHFEELGRAPSLLHGGFGLLTVGNLRKPRFWALALAEQQGDELLDARLEGDGAGSLVDCWATRHEDGTVDVLLWNGTLDQRKLSGHPLLDRQVQVRVERLGGGRRREATLARVDLRRSSFASRWQGRGEWPSEEQWAELRAADRLDEERIYDVRFEDGSAEVELALPMPGVARLRLSTSP
jgi:xylan 1,4-beta-xylosidase